MPKPATSPVVSARCFGLLSEPKELFNIEYCADRVDKEDCERGGKSSCNWISDPAGPQKGYCRGDWGKNK